MTAPLQHKSTLDGLPKHFVSAMRTLFEVMDDKRTGYIRLSDIEKRWQDSGTRGLPNGVIDCLRKVTPASGLLTFERFCAGLRICLLRHEPSRARGNHFKSRMSSRPASVPLPDRDVVNVRKQNPMGKILPSTGSSERLAKSNPVSPSRPMMRLNTAAVRPNNVRFAQQRAISMPHLQTGVKTYIPPPLPPNDPYLTYSNKIDQKRPPPPVPMSRAMVSRALEKWRMMKSYHPPDIHMPTTDVKVPQPQREPQLKRELMSFPNLPASINTSVPMENRVHMRERGPAAKKASRKREPRRHTVSSGIDYNMIKRLKLLEQEKDYLLQGMDVVERACNWYIQQIASVNEKLEHISKWDAPHSDYSTDAHRERLNFQMTRIFEVNQHLNALMATSERGFPMHMNLAVHQRNIYDKQHSAMQTIQQLKEQNHSLTEEIAKKSETITQLETDKSALIRELFQARSQQQKESDDNTLW